MAVSPSKCLFWFLFTCVVLWLLFIFVVRLVIQLLDRFAGASVEFQIAGWKCLTDVVVKFRKGSVESVSIGELNISLSQSLMKHGIRSFSKDPKIQVQVCDLEVVMRATTKGSQKTKTRKSRSGKGKGKLMLVGKIARVFSISVTDLKVKTPKCVLEIKGVSLDVNKDDPSKPTLLFKLVLLPITIRLGSSQVRSDQSENLSMIGSTAAETFSYVVDQSLAPFSCEELAFSCGFGPDRELGISIENVELHTGGISLNLCDEMLHKRKCSSNTTARPEEVINPAIIANSKEKKQSGLAAIPKYIAAFPEKVLFSLPKLNVKLSHNEYGIVLDNNIMGIQLKSIKSQSSDDTGDNTRIDVQMDFSEIHLLRENDISVLDITKVDIVSFFYIPLRPTSPLRVEVDVKLGGTLCNLMMSQLKPLMRFQSSKNKKMVLKEEVSKSGRPKSSEAMGIMWTGTVSAPEMTIMIYNFSCLPLYHVCSQSSHLFANNVASTGIVVHMELGELNFHLADEYQEGQKESLFGLETNSGSLLQVEKVRLDWGKKRIDTLEEDDKSLKLALFVDVSGVGFHLNFKRIESLISTALTLKQAVKHMSTTRKRMTQNHVEHVPRPSGKGTRLLKFSLEQCSINYCGQAGLENTVVPDPKRVNYGSQGGRVVISVSTDGTPRSADIVCTTDTFQKVKFSVSLDVTHLSLSLNKEKQSSQIELERARSFYQEFSEGDNVETKVALFDMQNAKFVRRLGGVKDISDCSLFSTTNIAVRWEPDVHLSLVELALHLKSAVVNHKPQDLGSDFMGSIVDTKERDQRKETVMETGKSEKKHKRKESVIAVDVEMLSISAELGDGVDAVVNIQSIFSENARIGVLLEGLMLCLNRSRVFNSSRIQISRIPKAPVISPERKLPAVTTWDWVIQGLSVHICMPYRLELRAIEDSIEEMTRALKLVTLAKTNLILPSKKESPKPKKPSSTKLGCIRFCIRKLTADIEEEPLQGWLDEHYRLLRNEACELAVRLNFLDQIIEGRHSIGTTETTDSLVQNSLHYNGAEIDMQDPSAIGKLREQIYKETFRSYYQACQTLTPSEGSGAYKAGFQSGFHSSAARTSLLSISAADLDVTLTRIEGGDEGMIDVIKALDPFCLENNIPFSRLYGSNFLLNTRLLVVQLRDYTFPLLSAGYGKCQGRIVLGQQATCFQPQIRQDVYIGKWRKVNMLRSASGTTPPMKTYLDVPLYFQKAEIGFGVGFEPSFTDISYAFTVALRRANLSVRNPNYQPPPPKKERSLPWWDEIRNYIHGNVKLHFSETLWNILGTTDPYEKLDRLQILSGWLEIHQSDGRVCLIANDFKILLSSLESLYSNHTIKAPPGKPAVFLEYPGFKVEVLIDWECESGNPMNHYLFALPIEGQPREKIYDPFRSTSLSIRLIISLQPSPPSQGKQSSSTGESNLPDGTVSVSPSSKESLEFSPIINMGAHDLAWLIKFWNLNYLPPQKLRSFSRWPRFGVPRIPRSGNLSLDRVMTEFMLRIEATPTCIRHLPLDKDDPAKGLTFSMTKLKYEMYLSRGKQKWTFECKREPLDLVYQGIDVHMLKAYLGKEDNGDTVKVVQTAVSSQLASRDRLPSENGTQMNGNSEKHSDDKFLLSSDYFTVRRQAPKADHARLLAWQEAGKKNMEVTYVKSEFESGSNSDESTRSDHSDDDGYNVVIADNCQRVFVYGLKLLWTIQNRDAVWSWVGGLTKAFEPQKPSPSRQYTQRKLLEEFQKNNGAENKLDDTPTSPAVPDVTSSSPKDVKVSSEGSSHSAAAESSTSDAAGKNESREEEGTCHFMVNVIEPQFNLHSEDANGRFLLAAVSGRVLARSFHSVVQVGLEVIERALGTENIQIHEAEPELTWSRMEFSVMLENVQAHVAPTDVDPGAGPQWLPKIHRKSLKVNRTGALLERVFMPCDMYFRYTRHKGGTTDLKVKPLKELTFNSHNITASMTSRQFQVMLDVLTNLLFARVPKPRKSGLLPPADDDGDAEEVADAVVPDGVEEVEVARINLERTEREKKLVVSDIRKLSNATDASNEFGLENESQLWMVTGSRPLLVQGLKRELVSAQKARKEAALCLRSALQKAAQQRLMEKEKNKSPSCAMRVSLQINKVGWSMLLDGKSFAEAEINNMRYDFDRDYKDVGVIKLTTKYFVIKNCLPNAKSDTLLAAWNPPTDWGKKVMVHIDAKQGAPKDGNSTFEHFQVDIYPLRIHLTEAMYRKMWGYLFPGEEQDSQRRQEVWKVSTTAGSKRVRKGSLISDPFTSSKESEGSKGRNSKPAIPELRRTSSFDRTWEENVAETVANEIVLQLHASSKSGTTVSIDEQDESSRSKLKDSKTVKSSRSSQDDKKTSKAQAQEEKRSSPRKMIEFREIKISQVELLVTYEGSRFAVSELKLLMDAFHRVEFTGTWSRLFSRVKKHIIWGVLKSVTGMQGKKFKDKAHSQKEISGTVVPDTSFNFSENEGLPGPSDQHPITWLKRPSDGAGDGFVNSVRGLFSTQRRKAKAFVLRTMRGDGDNEFHGEWSESEADFSPFARQLTITKTRKLIRRHTKKFRTKGKKGSFMLSFKFIFALLGLDK
uniref:FMP27/BLTP2/Hobbit GFWDK motif-containing RBG unit domain-containing protein n=1 Tax=Kalanchoe fedtschenkoi TaxID=63787 RepID=A0A7N0UUA0_KALFE